MADITDVSLVIWDLDGTLIDSFGVFSRVLKEAAALSGRDTPSEDTLRDHFHGSLDSSIKTALDMVDGEAAVIVLNDFLRIQNDYYAQPEDHFWPDARELVIRLHEQGCWQVVVTNRDHEGRGNGSPRRVIGNSSLSSMIDQIHCGDDDPYRKPDARVMDSIERFQQTPRPQVLVIGDQHVDAELADNLGVRAVIVDRWGSGSKLQSSDTVRIVKSLNEVS